MSNDWILSLRIDAKTNTNRGNEFRPEFAKYPLEYCEGFQGPCDNKKVEWFHTSTCYPEERSNWACMCEDCEGGMLQHWEEMWAEYYSGRL
jgi:hypothetical protein